MSNEAITTKTPTLPHRWAHRAGGVQWADLGLPQSSACSFFFCTACGAEFDHRYNVTPSIYRAIADAGIPANCPGEKR